MNEPLATESLLRTMSVAADLDDDDVRELAEVSQVHRFASGETIFREGQRWSTIYWVCSGRVTLVMAFPGRSAQPVLTVGAGEVLAWSAMAGDQQMTTTAIAAADSILLGFDAVGLQQLCEHNHKIGYRFMQQLAEGLARRLVATRLQLLDLFTHPGEELP